MLEQLMELFQYPFITRALIVGTLVSLCAALLGVSLVLKRYSMIGDGLSHVGLALWPAHRWLGLRRLRLPFPLWWPRQFYCCA